MTVPQLNNNNVCSTCSNIGICKYVDTINGLYTSNILEYHKCIYFCAKSNNAVPPSNDTVTSSRIESCNNSTESDADMIKKQLHDGKCHCCGYEGKVATCSSCGEDVCLNCAEIVSDITAADSDKEKLICRFCDDDDDNNDTEYIIPAGF